MLCEIWACILSYEYDIFLITFDDESCTKTKKRIKYNVNPHVCYVITEEQWY